MNGKLVRHTLPCFFLLLALVACSRGAPRAKSEAETPAASPAKDTSEPAQAGPAPAERAHPGEPADLTWDDGVDDREKKAEEPSLSQAPPAEAAGPTGENWQRLEREEEDFAQAMGPTALSCSGALPLRDAICQLAERICALPPGGASADAAQRDCERARASCEQAKKSYAGRCGG